ncbi:DUF3142 domain-containing protein [Haloferula sp. BvORR071]|uniref:DUF3142 domain-containing protein n=1 Tax=Haloferula sp. BvORR071 TaxID=1396141 RepID=UPI00055678FB|nr:DUF3142 domain-containing protein [Haloferula sp. BvORR071]
MASGRTILALLLFLLFTGCGKKPSPLASSHPPDPTPSFWVWHRSSALTPAEQFSVGGVSRLYWQIAEFGWRNGEWSPRPLGKPQADSPNLVPVVRLDPGPDSILKPDAAATLAKWLRFHFDGNPPHTLQLDYDCPVRLLPKYAEYISALRAELSLQELSVTALASWGGTPGLEKVGKAADEIVPMFYDITADPPADVLAGKFVPMAGGEAQKWIAKWKDCSTPWRAGLPNFERLTLFQSDGTLSGHLRQWSPETVLAADYLQPLSTAPGLALYRVTRDASLEGTALHAGQFLAWRAPDDETLRQLIASSFAAGARGIVWFALPGPGLRASHTPSHLAALARGESPQPSLKLQRDESGRITLRNEGSGDLIPAPGKAANRLKLTSSQAGAFAAVGPGEFLSVAVPSASRVSINFSHEIELTFHGLCVGEVVASESGLVTLKDGRELQWTIDDSTPVPLE